MDAPSVEVEHGLQFLLAERDLFAGLHYVPVQHLPLRRQPHSPVGTEKQFAAERLFQLPDGLAHRRLGKEQRSGRRRDAAQPRDVVKDLVVFKRNVHAAVLPSIRIPFS